MHADLRRISGMKSGHITACPVLRCLRNPGIAATALEKLEEGFVRFAVIHLLQQLVDFRKEGAGTELAVTNAPDISIHFFGMQVVAVKQVPDFRWFAVDE